MFKNSYRGTVVVAVMVTMLSSQLHALAAPHLVKNPVIHIFKAGWARGLVWTFWRRDKSHNPFRNQTLVTIPTASKKLYLEQSC